MNLQNENGCPEVVLASIAWYPDALDEERRGLVESHAAACPACREELTFVSGEALPEQDLPDADEVYAGVLARIERSEGAGRADTSAAGEPVARAPRRSWGAFGARPAALAAGIALALFCGALGALGGLLYGASEPDYQVAGELPQTTAAAPAGAPALDVVFRSDARAEQVHAALRAIGGQIVSGPTQLGVYRIELAPTADAAAAARLLQGEGQGVATFAQPASR
ncbi:MAG: S8 family serine peptidase [Myxococcota bacterium]